MLTREGMARLAAPLLALGLLCGCAGGGGGETPLPPAGAPTSAQAGPASAPPAPQAAGQAFYSFTDSLGNQVRLPAQPQRVVALLGSYAETWVLAGGSLVGVTKDVITENRLELPEGTELVGTMRDPSAEQVLGLAPDFVLLSPDVETHLALSGTLGKAGIPHAFFKVEYFGDYLKMLEVCTGITGRADLYEENGLRVQRQIDAVLQKVDDVGQGPTVLFIRALSTTAKAKSGDNMACRILEDLHTVNIAARHNSLLEDLSMEVILEEDPDFIFVVPMGDSDKAIAALREGIQQNPAWNSLTAVREGRYVVLPKELFHYKPNARWGESYAYMAKLLYPQRFE